MEVVNQPSLIDWEYPHIAHLAILDKRIAQWKCERNAAELSRALFYALMFAGHSGNHRTEYLERDFTRWLAVGLAGAYVPDYLPNRWNALRASARAFLASADILALFDLDAWTFARTLAANVKYIKHKTGCFAAALVGYDLAALDVWMLRTRAGFSDDGIRQERQRWQRKNGWDEYRATHDALFPVNPRDSQWQAYTLERTFAASGHAVYFSILGII